MGDLRKPREPIAARNILQMAYDHLPGALVYPNLSNLPSRRHSNSLEPSSDLSSMLELVDEEFEVWDDRGIARVVPPLADEIVSRKPPCDHRSLW